MIECRLNIDVSIFKEVLSLAIAGGIIVILAFAAIIKKYETRMVLLAAGFLMCIIGGEMERTNKVAINRIR